MTSPMLQSRTEEHRGELTCRSELHPSPSWKASENKGACLCPAGRLVALADLGALPSNILLNPKLKTHAKSHALKRSLTYMR